MMRRSTGYLRMGQIGTGSHRLTAPHLADELAGVIRSTQGAVRAGDT